MVLLWQVQGNNIVAIILKASRLDENDYFFRTLRKRRIASIFQHYYPEGGWGYVVLLVSFLIHLIANGLPFSFVLVIPVLSRRFKIEDINCASKIPFQDTIIILIKNLVFGKLISLYLLPILLIFIQVLHHFPP